MEKLFLKVNEFEGPMDLILHLLSKHKLNICDIEISDLLDQYMEWLKKMQELNLDISSEFLEMASRLVYIKTASLLPQTAEEAETEKKELIGQLIEYQACKDAANLLKSRNLGFSLFTRNLEAIEFDHTYRLNHKATVLVENYLNAVGKGKRRLPPPTEGFSPLVSAPVVSVNSQIVRIIRAFYKKATLGLKDLFTSSRSKSELVARFLAVLELVKGGRASLDTENETISFVPGHKNTTTLKLPLEKGEE